MKKTGCKKIIMDGRLDVTEGAGRLDSTGFLCAGVRRREMNPP